MITLTIKDDKTGVVKMYDVNGIVGGFVERVIGDRGFHAVVATENTTAGEFAQMIAEAEIAVEEAKKLLKHNSWIKRAKRKFKKENRNFIQENKENAE